MHTTDHEIYLELVEADEFEAILTGRAAPSAVGQRPGQLAVVAQGLLRDLITIPELPASSRLRIRNRLLRDVVSLRASMRAQVSDALYRRAHRVLLLLRTAGASGLATVVALAFGSGLVVQEAAAL